MGVVEIDESVTTTTTTIQRDSQAHSRTSPQLLLRLWSVSPADILDLSSFFAHTVASKLRLQPRHFGPQTLQPEISQHCQPQSVEQPLCCLYALRSCLSDFISIFNSIQVSLLHVTLHPLHSIHAHTTLYVLSVDRLEDQDAQKSYRTMLMHTRTSTMKSKKELIERDGAKRQAEGRGARKAIRSSAAAIHVICLCPNTSSLKLIPKFEPERRHNSS